VAIKKTEGQKSYSLREYLCNGNANIKELTNKVRLITLYVSTSIGNVLNFMAGENSELEPSIPEIVVPTGIPQVQIHRPPPPRDTVAMVIAWGIVGTFAIGVLLCFGFTFLLNVRPITETKYVDNGPKISKVEVSHNYNASFELFKTLSAIMSGPLGFVLGFYFRETQNQ
jgi:hypothetical protein